MTAVETFWTILLFVLFVYIALAVCGVSYAIRGIQRYRIEED